jgi:hypothetical protein
MSSEELQLHLLSKLNEVEPLKTQDLVGPAGETVSQLTWLAVLNSLKSKEVLIKILGKLF